MRKKLSKEERRKNRELLQRYHKKVTEEALEPLFGDFHSWKNGELHYDELTEKIHEFHKLNQNIWKRFNYNGVDDFFLVLEAKKELGLLSEEEAEEYNYWLEN